MRSWILLLVAAATASVASRVPADTYRIGYYDIRIRVEPDSRQLSGCVRAVGRVGTSPLAALGLDLAATMAVDSAFETRRGARREIVVARNGYVIRLTPPAPWMARDRLDITVCYHGTPSEKTVLFAGRGDSVRVGSYGLPYSAREWWPSHDSPAQKADSADISVSAPSSLSVISNGRRIERKERGDGFATTHWAVRYPIYPDVISLAVARYASFTLASRAGGGALPMQFFVFREDEAKARQDFSVLPRIAEYYGALLGKYPFAREKYGVAEFPFDSFREHQTIPSYGPGYITGDHRNDWILAHELAHQWFGDALTVRSWSDVWLNEGFATYSAFLWIEHDRGKAAYDSVISARMKLDYSGSVFIADSTDVDHMFGRSTFFKGALVLHMLRHVIGDSSFFRALRSYVAENRYQAVSTATFQAVCERVYRHPLDWFFKEWIYGMGAPEYTAQWTQRRVAHGFSVNVIVSQGQDGAPFTMPIDIALHTVSGDQTKRMIDSSRASPETFTVADSVTSVEVDPANWILKRLPVLHPGSAEINASHVGDLVEQLRYWTTAEGDTEIERPGFQQQEEHSISVAGVDAIQLVRVSSTPGQYSDTTLVRRVGLVPIGEHMHSGKTSKVFEYGGGRVRRNARVADSLKTPTDTTFQERVFAFNELDLLIRSLPFSEGYVRILPLYSEGDEALEMDTVTVSGRRTASVGAGNAQWTVRFADPAIVATYVVDAVTRRIIAHEAFNRQARMRVREVR